MKISKNSVTMGPYFTMTGRKVYAKLDFDLQVVGIVMHECDNEALFIVDMDTPDKVVFAMADVILNQYIYAV